MTEHPEKVPPSGQGGPEDALPEVLAASGCTLLYCAEPHVWPDFITWLNTRGLLDEEQSATVKREFLSQAAVVLAQVVRQIETELLTTKFERLLKEESEK